MRLFLDRKQLILLNALVLMSFFISSSAHAQEDPTATVVYELKSEKIKSSRFKGSKLYSNGDIKLKDGTLLKKDGTVHLPDGSTITPDGIAKHPDGRKYLPGGIVVNKDGTEEDICKKNPGCAEGRNNHFRHSNGKITGVVKETKFPVDSNGKLKRPTKN